ncbi:VrrA/YqfQ family protein [Bacillus massiliigorillae]|uniref:VrrA/YqfQ family protein n=1 Tax=Bacillus massiliigorillae TaxID=1243664 RepID=UPI00039A15C3|nr:VrrA/YqfQ family protein [Bacillus massiliigorillae]
MNTMFQNNRGNGFPRNSPPFQNNTPNHMPPTQNRMLPNAGPRPNMPMNMAPFPPPSNQGRFQNQMGPPQRGPMRQQQNFSQMPIDQQPYPNSQQKGGVLSKIFKKKERNSMLPPPPPPAPNGIGSPFALPSNQSRNAAVLASQPASTASRAAASTVASTAASGGGILKTMLDPSNLTNMLNNTQKVLQTAESFTPLVQQYGPLVKNIPAMWKLFRGLKDTDTTTAETTQTTVAPVNNPPVQQVIDTKIIENKQVPVQETVHIKPHVQPRKTSPSRTTETRRFRDGESKPKLFMK